MRGPVTAGLFTFQLVNVGIGTLKAAAFVAVLRHNVVKPTRG